MKQKNIAWKVVSVYENGKKLTSACSGDLFHKQCVDYTRKNVWIKPNKGCNPFLFVFDTRKNARKFKWKTINRILKVEIINPTQKVTTIDTKKILTVNDFIWKGTLFCDAVKVIGKG